MKQLFVVILLVGFLVLPGCLGQGKTIELDVETLKKQPYNTVTAPDPHLDMTIEFGGVFLRDVLNAFDIDMAEEIKVVAKDGYSAVIKWEDLDLGILIAYTVDGKDIPEDTGGPIRIAFSESAQKVYPPEAWVWWVTHL